MSRTIYSKTGGGSTNLEKVWRPLIPVESFTKDPEPIVPSVTKPVVGIRWGKVASFEFQMNQAKVQNQVIRRQGEVREVPRYYFENEIVDFTEIYREFYTGQVPVRPMKLPPLPPDRVWPQYLRDIHTFTQEQMGALRKVELERTSQWISPTEITFQRFDSNGEPVANVKVFYRFNFDAYILFNEFPKVVKGTRGEKPE